MFFERRLWRLVETFVPLLSDPDELINMVSLGGQYVRRLELSELMPPVFRATDIDPDNSQKGKHCE